MGGTNIITTDLSEIIYSLSRALDLSAIGMANHNQTVALISLAIAERLRLTEDQRDLIFLSALVHDAGVITKDESLEILTFEDVNPFEHCRKGYEIFSHSKHTQKIANVLLNHHDRWQGTSISGLKGDKIPLSSNIIYFADRVAVLVETSEGYILNHCNEIVAEICNKRGTTFNPLIVDAFLEISKTESFWLDLQPDFIYDLINQRKPKMKIHITIDELVDLAITFSKIIDNKSPFTYNHSTAVALVAEYLADKFCFSKNEKTMIKVAGYLHDLGKLAIPNEILDKPSKLTQEEFAIVKKHSYYSYRLLNNIPGFELISAWGPHHHEKLNGSGYPFGLKGEQIPLGAKIMAVSDIFVAVTEDRPYRKGLNHDECLNILKEASNREHIDKHIVSQVELNYNELLLLAKPT